MEIVKKFAAVCVEAFSPLVMVGGMLMLIIETVANFDGAVGGSNALFSLTWDQFYRLAVVMVAAGGVLTVLRQQWALNEMKGIFGNEAARRLMSEGIPPTIDYYHQYVGSGDFSIVNRFWQAGISGGRDSQGRTDLHIACQMGRPAIVQEILNRGGDPSITTSEGHTALIMAAVGGNTRIIELLSDHRCAIDAGTLDGGCSALYTAAAKGNLQAVEKLIELGARVDRPDNANVTPLMASIVQQHHEVARALIKAGANVARVDAIGATLLDYATTFSCPDDIVSQIKIRGISRSPDFLTASGQGCKWDGYVRVHWQKSRSVGET